MESLLILKQHLTRVYTRYEAYIVPVLKFLAMLFALLFINNSVGFMTKLKNPAIVLILSLLCSFLPANVIVLVAGFVIVAHMYALSLECAIVVLFIFIIMYALYFRFTPSDAIAVLLTPMAFVMHIPFVMPLAMGFTGNPISCISVGCGTAVYYILNYVSEHEDSLSGSSLDDLDIEAMMSGFKSVIDGILKNDLMIAMIITFAATIIVVYLIRRLKFNFAWQVALGAGIIVCFVTLLVSSSVLDADVGIGGAILSLFVSALIVLVLQFFIFNVDYSRAEYVQFEDDEYYYYVKAVPKIIVEEPAPTRGRRTAYRRDQMDFDDEDEEDY